MSILKENLLGKEGVEIVAKRQGQTAGSIVVTIKDGKAHIGYIGVKSEQRRKGIASELLEGAENWARSKGLTEMAGTLYPVPGSEISVRRLINRWGYEVNKNGNIRKALEK